VAQGTLLNTAALSAELVACLQMHMLLHLEELQQEVDVRRYDMKDAQLIASGKYLALEVCCATCWYRFVASLIGTAWHAPVFTATQLPAVPGHSA
jgi:hypothetical protein